MKMTFIMWLNGNQLIIVTSIFEDRLQTVIFAPERRRSLSMPTDFFTLKELPNFLINSYSLIPPEQ